MLNAMEFTVEFDRCVTKEHYISPGGYCVNEKNFDFLSTCGKIINSNSVNYYVSDFDTAYAEENGVNSITPEDITGDFSEFFIYTGEYDDPEINPVKVRDLVFYMNGETCPASKSTIKTVNDVLSN